MALNDRQRRIILAALSFFCNYGEAFVDLVKGDKEENKKRWIILRKEIKDLNDELREKFSQAAK